MLNTGGVFVLPLFICNFAKDMETTLIILGTILVLVVAGFFVGHHIKLEKEQRKSHKKVMLLFDKLDFNKKSYDTVKEKLEEVREVIQNLKIKPLTFEEVHALWAEENRKKVPVEYVGLEHYLDFNFTFNKI